MKNKGITLISLVVTIIILIILAGVSLNLTLGKNGIITMAKKAKENMEIAQIEEETKLNELYTQLGLESGGMGDISYDVIAEIKELKEMLSQTNAESKHILKDYKAYSKGQLLTGTMINQGAQTANLNAGESYTIPEGYHNGQGKVTANSLASQTQATATQEDIAEGKTAWVDGTLITGTNRKASGSGVIIPYLSPNINANNTSNLTEIQIDVSNYTDLDIESMWISSDVNYIYIYSDDTKIYSLTGKSASASNQHFDISSTKILKIHMWGYLYSGTPSYIRNLTMS